MYKDKIIKSNLFVFIILSLLIFIPLNVKAYYDDYVGEKPSNDYTYRYYPYVIDRYDISIKVNEDNILEITEDIDVYFNKAASGISREIPLEIENIETLESKYDKVKISNVIVNDTFETYVEGENYIIKTISKDGKLIGTKNYKFQYEYDLGNDLNVSYDELYYNLVGKEWETAIGNFTFNITMPKKFDTSKVELLTNDNGFIKYNMKFEVEGNSIRGKYDRIIRPDDKLSIRVRMPNGYFTYEKNPLIYFMYVVPVIAFIITFLLWNRYGKDDEVVETIEFYPPKGLNSLEVNYCYNGEADYKGVLSLFVYLANKGYIKIIENDKSKKKFTVEKIKEYDGTNRFEKRFMEELFGNSSLGSTINQEDLNYRLDGIVDSILSDINSKQNKQILFGQKKFKILIYILILISFANSLFFPAILSGSKEVRVVLTFSFLALILYTVIVSNLKRRVSIVVLCVLLLVFFALIMWLYEIGFVIFLNRSYLIATVVSVSCSLLILLFHRFMEKRTDYGTKILGKIKGFKNFLDTAEKEKLEALVSKYPTYFYDILPYAYALGVSNEWIKKFENMDVVSPSWLGGLFSLFCLDSQLEFSFLKNKNNYEDKGGTNIGSQNF